MTNLSEYITIDEKICNGKPIIRGQRITVNTVLEFLSAGDSTEDILEAYPFLTEKDVLACIKFAAELMNRNYIIQPTAA